MVIKPFRFQNETRCNFSFVARYSLKFTRCSLLIVKSLVTCCKICSLLVAEVAPCKKSLVTRCRNSSLQKIARYSGTNVYLQPIKMSELYLFILYFQLTKNRERLHTQ